MQTYTDHEPRFSPSEWNLPAVLRHHAAQRPDAIYLRCPAQDVTLTYERTLSTSEAIARSLLDAGGEPGDRVILMSPNRAEVILGWFGTALAGMAEVPINTAYRGSFLEHQISLVSPRLAIIDAEFVPRFIEAGPAASSIDRFFLLGDPSAVSTGIEELAAAGKTGLPFADLIDGTSTRELPVVRDRDLASIFFTSGTTGLSKGVTMTHAHMYFFADECASLTRLTPQDRYLSVGPLFHGNAQFLAAYPALIAGATFVLIERFSASRWIDQIRENHATVTNFVGVMMDFTWKQPERPDDSDNDLRCIFAAPTAWTVVDEFQKRFGVEAFVEVFGLTETSMPIMSPYGKPRPPGSAGLAVSDWFEVRLVHPDTDQEVAVGEVGELVVRAKVPWITTQEYWGMPEKTVESFRNLWFHTGDALRRDEDGWYSFVDRLKDAIRRRGENISSYEVEQAVLASGLVSQCAAVAVPADTEAGEDEVLLAVVAPPGEAIDPEAIWAWCRQRLPAFAMPRYIREMSALPITPSEKIRKNVIRDLGITAEVHDLTVAAPLTTSQSRG